MDHQNRNLDQYRPAYTRRCDSRKSITLLLIQLGPDHCGYPNLVTNFNGININLGTPYRDWSNFGTYADYEYGLYPAVDLTILFVKNGDNTLITNPGNGGADNKVALYPSTLAIIYSEPTMTRKVIYINEECDELGVSQSSYATTLEEATAYATFNNVDTSNVSSATLHSFAGSAGPGEGNLLWNGTTIVSLGWPQGNSSTASAQTANVTSYLTTNNEAGIQGTTSGGMDALQQILVVEYADATPVADFTGTPITGTAPLQVTFTNASTGNITSYAWDFDNNGTTDSTDTNPTYTYNTAGTYTVKLTATGPGGSDEETKTDYITVYGTPDLIASDLQIPSNPVIATAYPVSATVTNSGNGDATSLTVKLYDNNTQVAKGTLTSLASGASTPVSFDWTPATTGEHVLAVIADVNNEITESDETNNLVSTQITVNPSSQPDLTVTNLQLPSNPTIGTTSQVMVTITNQGTVDSGAFVVKLYDNNTQYATINLTGLAAGASTNVTFDWLTYTTGAHNLSIITDANQQINEYNKNNNQLSQQAIVSQSTLPDLAVSNLQLPASPTVAINSQVTATITNNGTVDSGAFVVKLYDNNVQVAKINLTGLSAGASTDVTFDWLTYTTGAHNLSIITDANQQINEYNKNNNQISQQATVNPSTQPDLTVTDLQLPSNPVAGNTYQITATITNLGTVDAGAFAVKLYDNNTQLGKINITSLSAGTSTQVTFNWTPTTGTHNLAIKADANQQITEYNEANNQITQQITVS